MLQVVEPLSLSADIAEETVIQIAVSGGPVSQRLRKEHFTNPENASIWTCVRELVDSGSTVSWASLRATYYRLFGVLIQIPKPPAAQAHEKGQFEVFADEIIAVWTEKQQREIGARINLATPGTPLAPLFRQGLAMSTAPMADDVEEGDRDPESVFAGLKRAGEWGIVSYLASYIHDGSPYPSVDVSFAGAFAMLAGVAGRSWSVNRNGLALYLMAIGKAGSGKNSPRTLCQQLLDQCLDEKLDGSEELKKTFAFRRDESVQGMTRMIIEAPCSWTMKSEIGQKLALMIGPKASPVEKAKLEMILQLFSDNSINGRMLGTAHSARNKDLDTQEIRSPSLTIFSETNPTTLFESINIGNIEDGLLSRFFFVQVPFLIEMNIDPLPPSTSLCECMCYLAKHCSTSSIMRPLQSSQRGHDMMMDFNSDSRKRSKALRDGPASGIWVRAMDQAQRFAGLISISKGAMSDALSSWGTIEDEDIEDAIEIVRREKMGILKLFSDKLKSADPHWMQLDAMREAVQRFAGKGKASGGSTVERKKVLDSMKNRGAFKGCSHRDMSSIWQVLEDNGEVVRDEKTRSIWKVFQ